MAKLRDLVLVFCLGACFTLCFLPRGTSAALSAERSTLREQRDELRGLQRLRELRRGNPVVVEEAGLDSHAEFAAVPPDHWAYQALAHLSEQGLLEGYPDGFFKGDRPLTRMEFAEAIAKMLPTTVADDESQLAAAALRLEFTEQLLELQGELDRMNQQLAELQQRIGRLQESQED